MHISLNISVFTSRHLFHCPKIPLLSSCRICCQFSALAQKIPTSNPLTQFTLSNPRSQLDTHFRSRYVFIYNNRAFSEVRPYLLTTEKAGNTPLSVSYLSFLDINTTVSTCTVCGNKSTGCTSSSLYPLSLSIFTSRASVAGSQDT